MRAGSKYERLYFRTLEVRHGHEIETVKSMTPPTEIRDQREVSGMFD